MESLSNQQPYLIGSRAHSSNKFPFLALDIRDNSCHPPRNVFQILHKHEELEFIWVEKNALHIQTPMSEITIKEGEGAFISKNVLHVLNTFGNCKCYGFLFPESLLVSSAYGDMGDMIIKYTENPLMDLVLIENRPSNKDILDSLKQLSIDAYKDPTEEYRCFHILSSLNSLWYNFTKNVHVNSDPIPKAMRARGDRLKKYAEFIQFNYHDSISINDIAASGFTSVSECNRTFKSLLKITAYEYLIQYRINRSLDLIRNGELTIAEIAYRVGYKSPSQFTKYFKHHMGITPSQYLRTWKDINSHSSY